MSKRPVKTKPYKPPHRRKVGSLYECRRCGREQVVAVDEYPDECCNSEMDYRGGKFLDTGDVADIESGRTVGLR